MLNVDADVKKTTSRHQRAKRPQRFWFDSDAAKKFQELYVSKVPEGGEAKVKLTIDDAHEGGDLLVCSGTFHFSIAGKEVDAGK